MTNVYPRSPRLVDKQPVLSLATVYSDSLSVCAEIFTNIPQLEAGVYADVVDDVQASWRTFNEGVAAYVEVVYTSFPWGAREAEG